MNRARAWHADALRIAALCRTLGLYGVARAHLAAAKAHRRFFI